MRLLKIIFQNRVGLLDRISKRRRVWEYCDQGHTIALDKDGAYILFQGIVLEEFELGITARALRMHREIAVDNMYLRLLKKGSKKINVRKL